MVVAVVKTWIDIRVILYLVVTLVLTFTIAIAFLVAFGSEVREFASLPESFFVLFTMVLSVSPNAPTHTTYTQHTAVTGVLVV